MRQFLHRAHRGAGSRWRRDIAIGEAIAVLTFVSLLFVLYHNLVKQKETTIETLQAQLNAAQNESPTELARRLDERVGIYEREMRRLSHDREANQIEISKLEAKLLELRSSLEDANKLLGELTAEYSCPHCGSSLVERMSIPMLEEYGGREIDYEIDVERYECGLETVDGEERSGCRVTSKRKRTIDTSKFQ